MTQRNQAQSFCLRCCLCIQHAKGSLTLKFALSDFEEEVTPGLLFRLRKKFFPMVDQISGMMGSMPS